MTTDTPPNRDLTSPRWKNYTRPRRARELRTALAADELDRANDPPVTDWYLEADEQDADR